MNEFSAIALGFLAWGHASALVAPSAGSNPIRQSLRLVFLVITAYSAQTLWGIQ